MAKKNASSRISRSAPAKILQQKNTWMWAWLFWLILHYLLGVASALSSAMIAFGQRPGTTLPFSPTTTELSLTALVCTTLVAFAKIKEQAGGYGRAFRKLNAAILRYERVETFDLKQLMDVHDQCEVLIEKSDPV